MPRQYTPYEFMQSWAAVEGDRKVLHHCNLLGTVNPKDLPGCKSIFPSKCSVRRTRGS